MPEIFDPVSPKSSAPTPAREASTRAREATANWVNGAGDDFTATLQRQIEARRESARSNERIERPPEHRPTSEVTRKAEAPTPDSTGPASRDTATPAQKPDSENSAKSSPEGQGTATTGASAAMPAEGDGREAASIAAADVAASAPATELDAQATPDTPSNEAAVLAGISLALANGAAAPRASIATAIPAATAEAVEGDTSGAEVLASPQSTTNAARGTATPAAGGSATPLTMTKDALPGEIVADAKTAADDQGQGRAAPAGLAAVREPPGRLALATLANKTVAPTAADQAGLEPGLPGGEPLPGGSAPLTTGAGIATRVASAATPPATAFIGTAADQPGFADEIGGRVVLFAGRGESRAELILTPPHLGRVEVSLTVSGDQTTAQFVAATPAARDALEQALPRLREMLAQAGITLGESNVNTQQGREDRESGRNQAYRGTAAIGAGIEMGAPGSSTRWLGQSNGLVDTFA